ncbi:hypothetical protein TNCT_39941 [Trichonephila clavata]|uniref:Uncharacterized protein n=1 Tax=Trichonephila clavata TaxID=2740835 RepID=A0A8X6K761_TRICU|nr:hypothetical protein TNCT_39941 [Trichonephila clavata]
MGQFENSKLLDSERTSEHLSRKMNYGSPSSYQMAGSWFGHCPENTSTRKGCARTEFRLRYCYVAGSSSCYDLESYRNTPYTQTQDLFHYFRCLCDTYNLAVLRGGTYFLPGQQHQLSSCKILGVSKIELPIPDSKT